MIKRPITPSQRAIWRNVSMRYPGFSEDVSDYFWKLADEYRLEAGTPEFVRMLLAKWPSGIDVRDLSLEKPDDVAKCATDSELVRQWTVEVREYHQVVESILDGEELLPVEGTEWQQLSRIQTLKEENTRLKSKIRILESDKANTDENFDNVPFKRKSSIYRLILGIAIGKFKYDPDRNGSTSSNIESVLRAAGHPLDEDTIRSILRAADSHLKGLDQS